MTCATCGKPCALVEHHFRVGLGTPAPDAQLWNAINGAGAWERNPWVWAVSFKRIAQETKAAD